MMKNLICVLVGLSVLSFSQNSWSMDKDPDKPTQDVNKRRTRRFVKPAPVSSEPPVDEIDPALLEQARQAVKLAERRLGLDKSPKIGIKAAK